jgi:DNA-binding MarR family transcriptional regulator
VADVLDELAGLLTGIHRLVRRRLRAGLVGPRLRGAQVELLRLVGARPGMRISAAAEQLYLAGNTISTLVNQLVEAGLLRRETAPDDRRAGLLFLTPEAARRMREWQERRHALMREQLHRLSEEDRGGAGRGGARPAQVGAGVARGG